MVTHPHVKINLGLDVLRKRQDGFHDIETVFVPSHQFCDTLEIVRADDCSTTLFPMMSGYSREEGQLVQAISDDGKVMVTIAKRDGVDWDPLDDLTVKAYRLLDSRFSLGPVKIFLEKTSPVGAGLGGGSSDAAYALSMMDSIFELGLGREALSGYASMLGSDCAFFLHDRPMFGSGRGEILSGYELPADFHDRYEIRIVAPEGIHVSTADAYRGIVPEVPGTPLLSRLALPVVEWKDNVFNAFETTVFRKYPALSRLKASLYDSGAIYASMSGSGSAFFAIYRR